MTKYVSTLTSPLYTCHLNHSDHREDYCEMKIKEKGLTGKAANVRKDLINRRGFNAFRLNEKDKKSSAKDGDKDGKDAGKPKAEVFLEFMGSKIKVHQDEEGNGTVKDEEVPVVKGATLKFEGCGGDVSWADIKVRSSSRFFSSFRAGS